MVMRKSSSVHEKPPLQQPRGGRHRNSYKAGLAASSLGELVRW